MGKTTLRDIESCISGAPSPGCGLKQVKAWLFKNQNNVSICMSRALDDPAARELLTESAGRTWAQVTAPDGKAQELWRTLGREFVRLARAGSKGLLVKVGDLPPKGLLRSIASREDTCRDVVRMCRDMCRHPLAIKADLIFPAHAALRLLPGEGVVRRWTESSHGARNAAGIPPVGDFPAALVVNRLAMMVSLVGHLALVANRSEDLLEMANWRHGLANQLGDVRSEIWVARDAQDRTGAMALLQTYLAGESHRGGFEADWSVIPWPAEPENMTLFIVDRPEQMDLIEAQGQDSLALRSGALAESIDRGLARLPDEVLAVVRGGLEGLRDRLEVHEGTRPRIWRIPAIIWTCITKHPMLAALLGIPMTIAIGVAITVISSEFEPNWISKTAWPAVKSFFEDIWPQ